MSEVKKIPLLAQYSLGFLWLFTGITSIVFAPEVGYSVLASGGIDGLWADLCLYSGSLLDIAIGLWVFSGYKEKYCLAVQFCVIVVFSVLLTLMVPSFWLHPFGPLTKNIPILAFIVILYTHALPHNSID